MVRGELQVTPDEYLFRKRAIMVAYWYHEITPGECTRALDALDALR